MKHIYILFFSIGILNLTLSAQSENIKWYFGLNGAMDFSSGSPVPLMNSAMSTAEGSASIADNSGNLLFYTNGESLWNRVHAVMPNGNGLTGSHISAQSALIVPAPGSNTQYYIFTVNNWTDGFTELRYSIVDMTLDGGTGDVTSTKNVLVNSNAREQLTATRHANGTDYWIVIHEAHNQNFQCYLLTSAGLNSTPVTSSTGMVYSGGNRFGSLRFSHDCKLVSALGSTDTIYETVQLFNFDNSTGKVDTIATLARNNSIPGAYSAEFSPDNNLLYVANYNTASIFQFNLTAPDIAATKTDITQGVVGDKCALALANDNKIYVGMSFAHSVSCINNPNIAGVGCGYQNDVLNLGSGSCGYAFPNFINTTGCIQSSPLPIPNFQASDTNICEKDCITFTDLSIGATSRKWTFEHGLPATDTSQNPSVCYLDTGKFAVVLVTTNSAGKDSLNLPNFITVNPEPVSPHIWRSNDTLYIFNDSSYAHIQWYDSARLITGATDTFFVIQRITSYNVQVTNGSGCKTQSGISLISGLPDLKSVDNFFFSPNPANNQLSVHALFEDWTKIKISVMNTLGQIVLPVASLQYKDEVIKIDVSSLPSGIYFIQLYGEKEHLVGRFVKE